MKVRIVVATWLMCWIVTFAGSTGADYRTVTFFTESLESWAYKNFILVLRKKLGSEITKYSIRVLPVDVPIESNDRFIIVKLWNQRVSVMIPLDVSDARALGFSVHGKSYFFDDVSDEIYKSKLFEGTIKSRLPFSGSYKGLEKVGASRENVILSKTELNEAIYELDKYSAYPTGKIASSVLVVIQMVSEGAGVEYLRSFLAWDDYSEFTPKYDVISIEDAWSDISNAMQTSSDGKFSPVALKDENNNTFYVSEIEQVKNSMGLLLGIKSSNGERFAI